MQLIEYKICIKFTEISNLDGPRQYMKIIIPQTECNDGNPDWRLGGSIATKQSDDAILLTLYKITPNQQPKAKEPHN